MGCNIRVHIVVTASTAEDTYRHYQLKGVLVHPHRRLILLHHGGDYSDANNLNRNENKSIMITGVVKEIIKGGGEKKMRGCIPITLGIINCEPSAKTTALLLHLALQQQTQRVIK